jgi:uncharacterized protein DUF4160
MSYIQHLTRHHVMAKLKCFTISGMELWFFSGDHRPPHFHARRKGQWEIRVYFLESERDEMFDIVRLDRKELPRADMKLLEKMVHEYRAQIFEEWRRKVRPQ